MKKILSAILPLLVIVNFTFAQTVSGPQGYRVVDLGTNNNGDYTQSLILLHEAYNGTLLAFNNAVGTLTAFRGHQGAFNRTNVALINTSSAYNATYGTVESITSDAIWKLKTCMYNGKLYLAVDIPYSPAYQNWGFQFAGWANSSGECLKVVNYMVNSQPVNQSLISNIQDFVPNMPQTIDVSQLNINGKVNITGLNSPGNYQLAVAGGIHSQSVQVDMIGWSDYVFKPSYSLASLAEVKSYIDQNHHLPEIPSAAQVAKEGINLGEMNAKLLKKIEELTLYLIEKDKQMDAQNTVIAKLLKDSREQQIELDKLKNQSTNSQNKIK
ncbi:hypothetical protein [Mucilaginibacter jinjuensis]|uniref:Uncharacterized protein n=1 Tax=Mucilaginibacter jinjuensis TaxID=1176721 RepID=A0ABY7TAZ9_9SPHI|nr:hypothetical protein [Mucilaginibacter jinjuensis]WCT13685.1 hypothetical protein PQO05_07015 [Mucilaginibacter jinjuensis]